MTARTKEPWRVSLHGGHSGEFCNHAHDTLSDILEAAAQAGYHTFGVSEHVARVESRFLYEEELDLGWDIAKVIRDFEAYGTSVRQTAEPFQDRLVVLCGFEIEVVPQDRYVDLMKDYRSRFGFDYMVGSVHFVDEILIDGPLHLFEKAVAGRGNLENLCVAYYDLLSEMIEALQPEVVGHLDLVRKNAPLDANLATPAIRSAVEGVLERVRAQGAILDLNTAGYRKGLGSPYPAPWLVQWANDMGIGFCFGDDSHSPGDVGAGIDAARLYLLDNGVTNVTVLTREAGAMVKKVVPLT